MYQVALQKTRVIINTLRVPRGRQKLVLGTRVFKTFDGDSD